MSISTVYSTYTGWSLLQGRRKADRHPRRVTTTVRRHTAPAHVKAALNYAMSLSCDCEMHIVQGFAENMYLDAKPPEQKVEETGGANFIFVTKDGQSGYTKEQTAFSFDHYVVLCNMLQGISLVWK